MRHFKSSKNLNSKKPLETKCYQKIIYLIENAVKTTHLGLITQIIR